jgi:hypothetical protein
MMDQRHTLATDFIAVIRAALDQEAAQTLTDAPYFRQRLADHFGVDPAALPVLRETVPSHDHPNLHRALQTVLEAPDRASELLGIASRHSHVEVSLSQLILPAAGRWSGTDLHSGPVRYVNVALHDDQVLACLHTGLFLVTDGDERLAVLVRGPDEQGWGDRSVHVQVMARAQPVAAALLAELRTQMRRENVYRGRIISVVGARGGELTISFHRLPPVARTGIILPAPVLARIEQATIGVTRHAARLRAAGRHLKRGVLLYGPPGTGKTLTAMYLAGRMPERTVLLLTGCDLGLIEESCTLARLLQPATLVLEDVDLVAQERTEQSVGANTVLFELLNQMDGLAEDADILFLLTTNRPELLEPALAARPGRVDLAVEVPLPDAECRHRLIELYGAGLTLQLTDPAGLVARTEGVSGAFIRELLRKAALLAADEGDELVVTDRHVDGALHALVVEGGPLTRRLLGAAPPA